MALSENRREFLPSIFKDIPLSLHEAAFRGDVDTLKHLIDDCGLISNIDRHLIWSGGSIPCAPLLLAVIGGHVDCIKFLIHKGANVNCVDDRGQSPLYIAAVNRNLNCIQILLQAAAKPNGSAHNRCTPLFFATRDGEVDIMRELINHGADINSAVHLSPKLYPNTLINTPLYISVSYNKLDCFKLLLQSGANPNFNCKRLDERNRLQSFYGEVSLVLFALFIRYSEFAKLLVEFGADLSLFSCNETLGNSHLILNNPCALYFQMARANPRILQSACRLLIRRCLGVTRLNYINDLPLPKFLKNYLFYKPV
uniref:Ankyrin repeat and SOCS box protein 1-like n=1 Tax=Callorhinchus milii TaxID=7868 RepID=A0A4W3J5Q4_CALMI